MKIKRAVRDREGRRAASGLTGRIGREEEERRPGGPPALPEQSPRLRGRGRALPSRSRGPVLTDAARTQRPPEGEQAPGAQLRVPEPPRPLPLSLPFPPKPRGAPQPPAHPPGTWAWGPAWAPLRSASRAARPLPRRPHRRRRRITRGRPQPPPHRACAAPPRRKARWGL